MYDARRAAVSIGRDEIQDDAARATLDHMPSELLRAEERTMQRALDHRAKAVRGELERWADEVAGGVVDEHVEVARFVEQARDRSGIAYVAGVCRTREALVLTRVRHAVSTRLASLEAITT